jgi:hypothetical protein
MTYRSVSSILAQGELASPAEVEQFRKSWAVAAANGSNESLLEFIAREKGVANDLFLQKLADALQLPFVELQHLSIPPEAHQRLSTKIAFQFSDGTLQIAVSNPFDAAMLSAVQFDAQGSVQFALAPRAEIEKALKKYYGVGAETLDK